MVATVATPKFDSRTYKPWNPVARPVGKTTDIAHPVVVRGPPTVAPKPGGKVFVYVYETPGNKGTHQTISHSGTLPPNAQLVIGKPPVTANGPSVHYPNSDELVGHDDPQARLRHRSKKTGKGYKLLADVSPGTLRSSSKGGKMFMKQKKRMDNYTSLASEGKSGEDQQPPPRSKSSMAERQTPWNMARSSSAAVKYIPASVYNSSLARERSKTKGQLLAPLHSPPPEWRAKVESEYRLYDDYQTLPTRRWNTVDATHRSHSSRCESAPPLDIYYNEADDNDAFYAASVNGVRPDSRSGIPAAVVNFDAKLHRGAPHRKQGVRTGRGMFMTTPYAHLDFNARPVGWSRAYAEQY